MHAMVGKAYAIDKRVTGVHYQSETFWMLALISFSEEFAEMRP